MLVLPLMVMGALLTVGGMFSLLLPETLHQSLPNTIEDGEEFGKDWGWRNCFTCRPPKKSVFLSEIIPLSIMMMIFAGNREKRQILCQSRR